MEGLSSENIDRGMQVPILGPPPRMFSLSFSIFPLERERRTEGYRTWGERERERDSDPETLKRNTALQQEQEHAGQELFFLSYFTANLSILFFTP